MLAHIFLSVTEEWKVDSDFLRKAFIRRFVVHADAQDLRVRLLELGETSLVRLEFLGSGRRVRQDVERQHHVPLAPKVAQPYLVSVLVG